MKIVREGAGRGGSATETAAKTTAKAEAAVSAFAGKAEDLMGDKAKGQENPAAHAHA